MKKATLIFTAVAFLALCITTTMQAQRHETLFSGKAGLTGFWGSSNFSYNRFPGETQALLPGSNFTFEFGRTVLVGWANYRLVEPLRSESGNRSVDMNYGGFYLGATPFSTKVLHPRFGVLLGRARVNGQRDLSVMRPSAGVELNVFRWFRLGLEGGYRFVGGSRIDGVTNADLSAPFVQLDFRFGYSW